MSEGLFVNSLRVNAEGKEILKGLDIAILPGEVHAIMGPNGSGKSTLASALTGHPKYEVVSGTASLDGKDLLAMKADERARAGLFLSFQYPLEIPGVTVEAFLRMAYNNIKPALDVMAFHRLLLERMQSLKMDPAFARRYLNDGFSGGEKKRMEVLQMSVLEPKYIILDETDSGLDVDALKAVSEGINAIRGPGRGILIITHFNRILRYVTPDHVHVMVDGKIIKSGDASLAHEIETKGYGLSY